MPSFDRRSLWKHSRRLSKNKLVQNAFALYGMQFCRKIVPLITIPYLARILGPAGWGSVAFVLSFGGLIVLLIEFGFNLSATREVARNRDSPEACGRIVAGVIGTQLLLFVLACTIAAIAVQWLPILRANPSLLIAGMFFALAQGFAPVWFLQGMEKLRLAATLDISGKLLGVLGLFLFVHTPQDGWKVLVIQSITPALSTLVSLWIMYRDIPMHMPSFHLIRQTMIAGWPLFLLRSGTSLYSIANVFILGLVAAPQLVGYYAGAEKLYVAFFGFLTPIQDALYPRLSNLAGTSEEDAGHLARVGAALMSGLGLALGLFVFFAAPFLVRLLMGPGFEAAVPVLRILSLMLPFGALAVSGTQWLLPLGRDHTVNRIVLSGGLLNVATAFALAPRFAHIGMAWSVAIAEAYVGLSMLWVVSRSTTFWSRPAQLRPDMPIDVSETFI